MSDEDSSQDLAVRLEWPEIGVESPLASQGSAKQRRSRRATKAAQPGSALVPVRRAAKQPPDEDSDSTPPAGPGKRTEAQLRALAKKVDAVARTVDAMPSAAGVAQMMGRVDALAGVVETLCAHVGSGDERLATLREEIRVCFSPLQQATDEVRRLREAVTTSLLERSERHGELTSQIDTLSSMIRSLRKSVPVTKPGKAEEQSNVVDAIAAAVREALDPEATGSTRTSEGRSSAVRAKTA